MLRISRRKLVQVTVASWAGSLIPSRGHAAGSAFGRAKDAKSISVGIANEKPYGYVDTDGKLTGAIIEVLRSAVAPYGITEVKGTIADFDALIPGVNAGRFDIIGAGMYVRPKRCEAIAFSNPLTRAGGAFAAKKGNPKNLHSLKDVAAKKDAKIGTQTGTAQVEEIKSAGIAGDQLVLFTKDTEALAGLKAGRVDVIYFPDLELNDLITTSNSPDVERVSGFQQIQKPDGTPAYNYQALGFRKEDTDLVEAINVQLATLLSSGKLLSILKPFGFTENELPEPEVTAAKLCVG
jgi:polar amino acid transport system substrate-binding protein